MAALTPQQRALLQKVLAQLPNSPKIRKAAVETAIVESGISNPSGGDADSAGWRQERASLYPNPTNVAASARRFGQEAAAVKGKYGTAGALAAAVQRPAAQYRGRYQQVSGEADQILRQLGVGGTAGGGSRTTTTTTTGGPSANARRQVLAQWLVSGGNDLPALAAQITALPGQTTTRTVKQNLPVTHASVAAGIHSVRDVLALPGTVQFDGKPVAAWVGHVLSYARHHGWTGSLSSGYRSDAEQTRIYQSGVRPAAVPKSMGGPGSNHEGTRYPLGAADVTQPQQLSAILKRSPYAQILQYAGAKDPPHFSHPHNGSY